MAMSPNEVAMFENLPHLHKDYLYLITTEILWGTLLPPIENHLYSDAIWCRVCERWISQIPDRCLESVIVPLIEQASWSVIVPGDSLYIYVCVYIYIYIYIYTERERLIYIIYFEHIVTFKTLYSLVCI